MLVSLALNKDNALQRVERLAQSVFLERAQYFDECAGFPTENFDDLFAEGLMTVPVDKKWGGLGMSPSYGDVYSLWCMTSAIAKADLSFARCWEGHNNALMLIDALANDSQKKRWFNEIVQKGQRWAAWSGEPQSQIPGQTKAIGTTVEAVEGGYVVNGNKLFATSAVGANWAVLLVSLNGPGGARDAVDGDKHLLLLACDLSDTSISFDDSWWNPIGMRATVSYKVNFNRTFIPIENCIGEVGAYITQGFQACFTPHYAASFLGAAQGAYDYALDYISTQKKQTDPYVQHHIAKINIQLQTLSLWLRHVANQLAEEDMANARLEGNKIRYLAEQLSEDCIKRCIKICGARSLNKPSRLEKIYRDLSMYVLHDNADHVLATVGRSLLDLPVDEAFFKLKA